MNTKELYQLRKQDEDVLNDKELYQVQKQDQLNEWKAEVEAHKTTIHAASPDAQLDMNSMIEALESKIESGKARLADIADANEEAWESIKEGVESAWDSMKSDMSEVAARFKK